jgi:hypothetical protein
LYSSPLTILDFPLLIPSLMLISVYPVTHRTPSLMKTFSLLYLVALLHTLALRFVL